jgi:hypothetical protein
MRSPWCLFVYPSFCPSVGVSPPKFSYEAYEIALLSVYMCLRLFFSVSFQAHFVSKESRRSVLLRNSYILLISIFLFGRSDASRSQWPRGLRHELSSLARTLGSWVGIPFRACMSVRVYSVIVLFCV